MLGKEKLTGSVLSPVWPFSSRVARIRIQRTEVSLPSQEKKSSGFSRESSLETTAFRTMAVILSAAWAVGSSFRHW